MIEEQTQVKEREWIWRKFCQYWQGLESVCFFSNWNNFVVKTFLGFHKISWDNLNFPIGKQSITSLRVLLTGLAGWGALSFVSGWLWHLVTATYYCKDLFCCFKNQVVQLGFVFFKTFPSVLYFPDYFSSAHIEKTDWKAAWLIFPSF